MHKDRLPEFSTSLSCKFADVSVIIPCHQEARNLEILLPTLQRINGGAEIIIVDDGSTDDTPEVCRKHQVRLVSHPYRMGNGAAIKKGARCARGSILVLMDGDGQHSPSDIPRLLQRMNEGFDMVVGARDGNSHASKSRRFANRIFNFLASYMTGHPIADLTSGFRAVRATKFLEFLYLLPNSFSYPTTITMAFFRSGFPVSYVPIKATRRNGKSHVSPLKDGIRFLLIIVKIGVLYSPLKIFLPVSLLFFFAGLIHYIQTYIFHERFTNMSALLLSISVLIFLIGLVSEQITQLMYREAPQSANMNNERRRS